MNREMSMEVLREQSVRAIDIVREQGIASLISKSLAAPGIMLRSALSRRQLKGLRSDSSIEQLVEFVFNIKHWFDLFLGKFNKLQIGGRDIPKIHRNNNTA